MHALSVEAPQKQTTYNTPIVSEILSVWMGVLDSLFNQVYLSIQYLVQHTTIVNSQKQICNKPHLVVYKIMIIS